MPGSPAPPSKEAIIEAALPRGGSLTGSTDVMALAADRLTGAPLVRVNRSTDGSSPGSPSRGPICRQPYIYGQVAARPHVGRRRAATDGRRRRAIAAAR